MAKKKIKTKLHCDSEEEKIIKCNLTFNLGKEENNFIFFSTKEEEVNYDETIDNLIEYFISLKEKTDLELIIEEKEKESNFKNSSEKLALEEIRKNIEKEINKIIEY